ncbi:MULTISPECIES: regulatory protein RecX [Robiginitalea]|uniref:Regulatory protein RecX n=1 Tax=Robiginitalea biformata (strain ATCC BAA-864 / DSM 15991 / KCTC 12146 / HTCC2501) TaxID=313596 RepID=A4CIT0_ROBBH|nr:MULTISPECIES: regulatory protein RecX [Robiginitalea]EAR16838.1 putative transcriptional regulatory protein [Robiginitalea biformata HTCC2501]MDC6352957.1 regulatory protein RecX [Robiginitalea sp. PM2]MDC6373876.1 regulatory protein RecX [Robiginitalea sp. SP8]
MAPFGRKNYTVEDATRRMERYCAYQERCHQEVVRKLQGMRMIPEAIDQIVVHLIEGNFLNEERFALEFARGKFRQKSWGRNRIGRELRMRGISDYLVRKALGSIPEEAYREQFEKLADKRRESLRGKPAAEIRQKLHSYLYYRGWENERIYEYLGGLEFPD